MGQDRQRLAARKPAARSPERAGWWSRTAHGLRKSRRWQVTTIVAFVVVVAGVAVWAVVASDDPKPRVREYLAFKACLLTDAHGVAGKEAAPVWAGMERASARTRAKVQSLPAFGPPTSANARTYLRTLAGQRCDVIVAVGAGPVAAVAAESAAYSKTRFIVAGKAPSAPNVTVIDVGPGEMATAVSDAMVRRVRAG